jgi:hypothetical protein
MKRYWSWLFCAALAAAAVPAAATAHADDKGENETPTSLDKIPPAARDALMREAGGAPIMEVVQESEKGQTVYEAHVRKGNDVLGITVDGSGKVLGKHSESGEKEHR